MSLFSAL